MRRTLTLIAASAAALTLSLGAAAPAIACGGHAKKAPQQAATTTGTTTTTTAQSDTEAEAEAPLVHQGEAKVGDRTFCPVMGNAFLITADSPSVEHEGKTIFFCCAGCNDQFAEDPAGMLDAANRAIDEMNTAAAAE